MLNEEQQTELINLCTMMTELINTSRKMLTEGQEKLVTMTKLLQQSTEDNSLLLAFIRSKGLQPPTTYAA